MNNSGRIANQMKGGKELKERRGGVHTKHYLLSHCSRSQLASIAPPPPQVNNDEHTKYRVIVANLNSIAAHAACAHKASSVRHNFAYQSVKFIAVAKPVTNEQCHAHILLIY